MLLGAVVWAATQTAESSNKENNGAFNFMAVSPLQIMFFITDCRRGLGALESGGISRFLKAFPYCVYRGQVKIWFESCWCAEIKSGASENIVSLSDGGRIECC